MSMCPHCDFQRMPQPVRRTSHEPRFWLRPALVIVVALLASFRPRG
ncbi:hypothetical protein [Caballeronia fortuita]|nr:hypothetical protein [Caballeronia fortuita]